MKSQDIVILLKLVSLDQQARASEESKEQSATASIPGWEGWIQNDDQHNGHSSGHSSGQIKENSFSYINQPVLAEAWSNRGLEASTGISKSEVNASLKRSFEVGMARLDRKSKRPKANVSALLEFIIHGIKYVYPAKPSAMVRGIPTSIAAPVLKSKLMSAGEYICVWPDAMGKEMGQSVAPLYKTVPMAVKKDYRLYEYLALVDAIRIGQSRERAYAADVLEKRLRA